MDREVSDCASSAVLCAANAYIQKYFFNPRFQNLPKEVQETLQKIAVVFTEEFGGIFLLQFSAEGKLGITVVQDETDALYDTIGAELKRKQIAREYSTLFSKLEEYYRGLLEIESEEKKKS